MAVLLTRLELDIDIVETIDLLTLENISKVEWSIQSLDCKVAPPSTTVFIKGELIADIECINKGLKSKNPFIEGPYSMVKNDKYSLAKLT